MAHVLICLFQRRKVKKVATEGGEVQGQEGKGEGEGEGEKKEGEEEEEEEHDPFEDVDQDTRIEFECCAFECLGKSWPSNVETQSKSPFLVKLKFQSYAIDV